MFYGDQGLEKINRGGLDLYITMSISNTQKGLTSLGKCCIGVDGDEKSNIDRLDR